jgi:methionine synthase I (cobalamin-dependent)
VVGNEVVYSGTPEVMADYASTVYQAGAKLIGGCCGSTPDHILAMAQRLSQIS